MKRFYFVLFTTATTILIMRLWPSDGSMSYLTVGILSPLFNLDGESSYDAYLAEAFIVIWILVALVVRFIPIKFKTK